MLLDIFKVDQDWKLKNLSKKHPKLIIDEIRGLIEDVAHPISDIYKTLLHFELEQLLYGNNKNKHRISFIKTLIYFGLIQNLNGVTSDISIWNNVKSTLDNYDMNITYHYDDERYRCFEYAINFFHKHNYKIEIRKSKLDLENNSKYHFFNHIKSLIKETSHFGLHMTLCHLHEKYDVYIKRFIFDYPGFRADLRKEIPLGYLINVFLPYMTSYTYNYNKIPIKIKKKYKLLIEYLNNYFILIDGIYNEPKFSNEFLDRGSVFDNILKHLIHDQIFSIYQLSDHVLEKMLDLFPDTTKGKILVKSILQRNNNNIHWPICRIEKNSVLLDFDYNEQTVNANYLIPILDYEKNDRESKPMIFNEKDNMLYFLGSEFSLFNNISWYNFLKDNSNIDDKRYGFIVEDFLSSLFDEKDINYIKGAKYNQSKLVGIDSSINKGGECDFIIESNDYIFFIELKIKRLTFKSQGGDLKSLLIDYCKSYLTSINQALNHEVILKSTGKLDLILEDGSFLEINLKNNNGCDRKVERISLSLFEFNSLQDSRYLNNILSVFRKVYFYNNDNKFDEEINSLIEKINNKVKLLDMNINDFLLSNRRLSIPQIIELIKISTNKDEFIHYLNIDRNITLDKSNDWYRKIHFLLNLGKNQSS